MLLILQILKEKIQLYQVKNLNQILKYLNLNFHLFYQKHSM